MAKKQFEIKLANIIPRYAIVVIVSISLIVKLAFVVLFGGGLTAFPTEGSDNSFYFTSAINLLKTNVYGNEAGIPTVGMPPGQSVYLAFLYAIGGGSLLILKLGQILLLTVTAVVVFLTARMLVDQVFGFWVALLVAVDPAQAYLSATFLSEPLFIFLMVLGIYCLVRYGTQSFPAWLLGAGVCFGLAGLTRNQGWLFSVFLIFSAVLTFGRIIQVRAALIVVAVTIVVTAPWTYRNYRITGEFIPVSAEGGLTLWASNNPDFVWRQPMPMSLPIYQIPDELKGFEVDAYYRQRALAWILANPGRFAANGVRKIVALYHFDPLSARPEVSALYRLGGLIPYGFMLPFIFVGIVTHLHDHRFWLFYIYIVFTSVLAVIFWGDSRIRAPIQPYLYLFGVLGIYHVSTWWRKWHINRSLASESGNLGG